MSGIIRQKNGMTSIFGEDGKNYQCTLDWSCVVTQVKRQKSVKFTGCSIGTMEEKKRKVFYQAMIEFRKTGTTPKSKLVEFKEFDEGIKWPLLYYPYLMY